MAHLIPRQAKVRVVLFGKHEIKLYSIGWMAYAFRRHPETVKAWERSGILPDPLLKTGGKWRYYTANEIEAYALIFQSFGVGSGNRIDKQKFAMAFHDKHAELKQLFRGSPSAVKARLHNEAALLQYAATLLDDNNRADLN